ncbi:MAG: type II secretion system protein [Verrucomicrobiales bacterium]|nr:type II secretion system protein [Verrucomicrobiales bacterium]
MRTPNTKRAGFTLVEMIGVLAIIAILTALLLPKIFQVINDSKISSSLMSYNSAKSAAAAHYGKWGRFAAADGGTLTVSAGTSGNLYEDWDAVLVSGGYLETPFALKVGNGDQGSAADGARLRVVNISGLTTASLVTALADDETGSYKLAAVTGAGTNSVPTVDVTGSYLVEAVVPGVNIEDARELNGRIDGAVTGLGGQSWLVGATNFTADLTGRVKWSTQSGGPTVDVYMYVAHR